MGTLQEVLAVLLGAESEAKRIVEDSKSESDGFLRSAQEKFAMERTNQMASAREQAKAVLENETTARPTSAARTRQSPLEAFISSAVRSIGSQIGRQLVRSLLGSLKR